MQNIRIIPTYQAACRFISLSSISHKGYAGRESKFLSKMINKSEPKRKWYKNNPNSFRKNLDLDIMKTNLTSFHVQRRMVVLNKLFMKHITELMSNGSFAPEILELNIEVTHVSLTPDFKHANIFWTHEQINNKDWLATTTEILQKCAFTLRHELSQLKLISYVPQLQFVKDKAYLLEKEIEEKLALANIDKNYEHVSLTLEPTIQICSSSKIDKTISNVNDNKILGSNDFEIILPQMKHNVLGLDHHNIMSKVKNIKNKSTFTSKDSKTYSKFTSDKMGVADEQQDLFAQFLKKRRIQAKKRYKLKFVDEIDNESYQYDI